MIKKRYLMILSVAVISFLLGSLLFSSITQAPKGKESTEVEVTNFPLDEQGNLRVSYGASKVITVEKDLNVSYPDHYWQALPLFTTAPIEVDGFKEFYVYFGIRNWTSNVELSFVVISIVDGIESYVQPEGGSTNVLTTTLQNVSARYYVWGSTVKIGIYGRAETVGGWLLVSVSLYLRN